MARRIRLGLVTDERTAQISDEALVCRSTGHRWIVKPQSEQRLRVTLVNGIIELDRFCDNGCGSSWLDVLDARTFEVLETRRRYSSDYLIKPGYGRLPRNEARKSNFVRQFPQFA